MSPARKRSRELVAVPSSAWVSRAPWHFPSLSEDKAREVVMLSREAELRAAEPEFYPAGALAQAEYEMARNFDLTLRHAAAERDEHYHAILGAGWDWNWYKANRKPEPGDIASALPGDLDERVDRIWAMFRAQEQS